MKVTYRKRTDTKTPTWQYALTFEGKRHRRSGFKTRREAEIQAGIMYQKLLSGSTGNENITFKEYAFNWLELNKRDKVNDTTYSKYLYAYNHLLKEFGEDIKMKSITRQKYQIFLNNYAKGNTKLSVRQFHSHFIKMFEEAVYDDVIKKDPTFNIVIKGGEDVRQENEKFLELEDFERVIEYLKSSDRKIDMLLLLIALTGARVSEVNHMMYEDVFNRTDTVYLRGTKTESAPREVSIHKKDLKLIQDKLRKYPRNINNEVFGYYIAKPSYELKKVQSALGIKKNMFPHMLRHTHCSYLYSKGVEIDFISKRLGHKDITITLQRYKHIFNSDKLKADEKIRDLFG